MYKRLKSIFIFENATHLKWYLIVLTIATNLSSYGQSNEKGTKAFVSTEFIIPSKISTIKGDLELNFSLGWGIGLNLKTNFSKNLSLLYGLGYASVRKNFLVDGFSDFASFAQFKTPIYIQYSLFLDRKRKHTLNFIAGTQVIFQTGSKISGTGKSSGNKEFIVEKIGGVFPLVSFGFGYDFKFKNNYFISFTSTYNIGFSDVMDVRYTAGEKVLEYSTQLSHFNLKFSFPLFIPK